VVSLVEGTNVLYFLKEDKRMLSIKFTTPNGEKSSIVDESIEGLWNGLWDSFSTVMQTPQSLPATAGYVNTCLNTSNNATFTTTTSATGGTSGISTNGSWGVMGGTYSTPLVNTYTIQTPVDYYVYPWNVYTPIQKLPTYFASNPSTPPVDIWKEKDGTLKYRFAVAGYSEKDVEVEFEDNHLIVTLDKEEDKKELKKRDYLVKGIKTGKISNKYYVGEKFNTKEATAKLKEGILEVSIPMKEDSKPTKVSVTKE
jgi:HSP20 family protein